MKLEIFKKKYLSIKGRRDMQKKLQQDRVKKVFPFFFLNSGELKFIGYGKERKKGGRG